MVNKVKFYKNFKVSEIHKNSILLIGNFDGLHLGHQKLFKLANDYKKKFKLKIGVVTFEPMPKMYFNRSIKNFRISNLNQKKIILKSLGIDFVIIKKFDKKFSKIKSYQFIKDILYRRLKAKTTSQLTFLRPSRAGISYYVRATSLSLIMLGCRAMLMHYSHARCSHMMTMYNPAYVFCIEYRMVDADMLFSTVLTFASTPLRLKASRTVSHSPAASAAATKSLAVSSSKTAVLARSCVLVLTYL